MDDADAIADVLKRLEQTWAAGDADGYGQLFTDDCTYMTWVGTAYRGRADVVASHSALWHRFLKGTQLAGEVTSVRFLAPDVAVATGHGDVHKGKKTRRLSKVQTFVLVRGPEGAWRIAAFHNTKRRALMEAISFKTDPRLVPMDQRPNGS